MNFYARSISLEHIIKSEIADLSRKNFKLQSLLLQKVVWISTSATLSSIVIIF